MSKPLVSVVLPTHNRADFVCNAIKSVLDQSEKRFELIVIDDASTDSTQNVVNQFAKLDSRIKIVQNICSLGGAGARNVGIAASTGDWIAFLDDDDIWKQTKLRSQLDRMYADPLAVACSCCYVRHTPNGDKRFVEVQDGVTLQELFRSNRLGGASMCLASRSLLLSIGGFDETLRSGQDWDLWVRLRYHGTIAVCQEPLIEYQAHNGNRISNNMNSQHQGVRRFYFKHRKAMNVQLRKYRVSASCFVMSRQTSRPLIQRFRYLVLSLRHSGLESGWSYIRSSLPRLLWDCFRRLIKSPMHSK
jgi:glycosyltransferase involved in cell wall biosynthesis